MGQLHREDVIHDCLDDRVVTFSDDTEWQLTKKICEKPWTDSSTREDEDWQPSEAHAVYECTQTGGPDPGSVAIVKVRIEWLPKKKLIDLLCVGQLIRPRVPYTLPPSDDESERSKAASGMQLNHFTKREIETLERLTAGGCSSTPKLLAVKVDVQDESVLDWIDRSEFKTESPDRKWWMPGGYIVYILMAKLSAQPLDINSFWNEQIFTLQDRDEIRIAFQKAYEEVRKQGVICFDAKLENLMWDNTLKKCYIIDLEDTEYDPEYAKPPFAIRYEYHQWNLARDWAKPNW